MRVHISELNQREQPRKFEIDSERLKNLMNEMSIERIGEKFNVSGNAIRKRAKKLKLDIPKFPIGYWLKKIYGRGETQQTRQS